MFTINDLRPLLSAQPFVPFRLHLSDGSAVEVRRRDLAFPGRHCLIVGLPESAEPDAPFDRHIVAWDGYMTRVEMLKPSSPPSGPAQTPTPSPV